MLIGIDASRANRKRKTGTEWYSFYLIENLAKLDKNNTYRLYVDDKPSPELQEAIEKNPNFSIKFLNWPFISFWTLGRLSLEMIIARPDVLFVPAHALPLFFPSKTITTIHDLAFMHEQNLYRPERVKTKSARARKTIHFLVKLFTFGKYGADSVDYLYWSTAYALNHATKIITVSEATKLDILNFFPKTKLKKISVIHNGFNNELYRPNLNKEKINSILEKYGLEAPYFLYIGRLEKKKNTATLIESYAIAKENNPSLTEKLVLIGNAGYGYDEIQYVIEEFNLNKEVLMPGWVNEEDVPYILNGASAFVFPSRHEGFGIPVIQSLACGVPTAVSDIAVLHEIAADSVLYFDQNSKASISEAMGKIITDTNLREELKSKGIERAKSFSWEICAIETLKEIEGLIRSGK
jgi:glycosyltransferase involved in cell wall biosynthesis